jgi:hypothetical protein
VLHPRADSQESSRHRQAAPDFHAGRPALIWTDAGASPESRLARESSRRPPSAPDSLAGQPAMIRTVGDVSMEGPGTCQVGALEPVAPRLRAQLPERILRSSSRIRWSRPSHPTMPRPLKALRLRCREGPTFAHGRPQRGGRARGKSPRGSPRGATGVRGLVGSAYARS